MTGDDCPSFILCEHCGSEGRIYRGHPNDPDPQDCGPCPVCDGYGYEMVVLTPIDIDDLSAMAETQPTGTER